MKKKRRITVFLLLSIVVLFFACDYKKIGMLSEASSMEDGCGHTFCNVHELSVSYPNATDLTHQKKVNCIIRCRKCGYSWYDSYYVSEPHTIDSATNRCACGYVPHH